MACAQNAVHKYVTKIVGQKMPLEFHTNSLVNSALRALHKLLSHRKKGANVLGQGLLDFPAWCEHKELKPTHYDRLVGTRHDTVAKNGGLTFADRTTITTYLDHLIDGCGVANKLAESCQYYVSSPAMMASFRALGVLYLQYLVPFRAVVKSNKIGASQWDMNKVIQALFKWQAALSKDIEPLFTEEAGYWLKDALSTDQYKELRRIITKNIKRDGGIESSVKDDKESNVLCRELLEHFPAALKVQLEANSSGHLEGGKYTEAAMKMLALIVPPVRFSLCMS